MGKELEERIRFALREDRWRLTRHAEIEMANDDIGLGELLAAMSSAQMEVIEDYPEDERGHSHLVLSWVRGSVPCHVCCAVHDQQLVIITVYVPNPDKWSDDWRVRR